MKVLLFTAEISLQRVIWFMNKLTKFRIYAALAAGLALSPIAAHAQASPAATAAGTTTTMTDATGTDARGDRNNHHDYGWIGLAGLLGLAGLMGRNRDDRYEAANGRTRRSDLAGTRS